MRRDGVGGAASRPPTRGRHAARTPPRADADPRSAAVVVLAVAEAAVDADRPAVRVDDDDRVHAIGLARAAEVLDRFAGAVRARGE